MAISLQNNSFLAAIEAAMNQDQAPAETSMPARGRRQQKGSKPKVKPAGRKAARQDPRLLDEISAEELDTFTPTTPEQRDPRLLDELSANELASFKPSTPAQRDPRLLDELSMEDLATFTPSAPTKTRETMPKLEDEMRSIDTGETPSIYSAMPKAEMGAYEKPEAASAMKQSIADVAAAAPEPSLDDDLLNKLFQTTHGTSYNPKSPKDEKAMGEIKSLLTDMGGKLGKVTPNQFALQVYRKFKYV